MTADTNKVELNGRVLEPVEFDFNTHPIRAFTDGEQVWLIADDIANILGYSQADRLTLVVDEDERSHHTVRTLGGPQSLLTVSESGCYHAIFKSRKPGAQKFRRWITGTVLPEIRRTGRYGGSPTKASGSQYGEQYEEVRRMAINTRRAEMDLGLLKHEIAGLQLKYGQLADLCESAIKSDRDWINLPPDCDPYGLISGQVYTRFARIIEAMNQATALYNEVLKPEGSTDKAYLVVRRGMARNSVHGSEIDLERSHGHDA